MAHGTTLPAPVRAVMPRSRRALGAPGRNRSDSHPLGNNNPFHESALNSKVSGLP